MPMIELPRSKSSPIDVSHVVSLSTPDPKTPDPKSRLILTIALLAVEDPTLLGPEDVQLLGQAMLDQNFGRQSLSESAQ